MAKPFLAAVAAVAFALAGFAGPARAQEEAPSPPHLQWSFDGVFGTYDRAALQRGFQVYQKVCAACHPVKHLSYRDLEEIGYTEDQVKGIAAQYQTTDGPNDQGEMFQRPARPSDRFAMPFPNDNAARAANNGALPPDLSLIVKAREHGPDYVDAILTGFVDAPKDFKVGEGMYYNAAFPGHQILAQAADRRQRQDVGDAAALQCIDIGAEIDGGRRQGVAAPVPRQKHDRLAAEGAEAQFVGGGAERALDPAPLDIAEPVDPVKPAAADNADDAHRASIADLSGSPTTPCAWRRRAALPR
jgi:cytochrome c1